MPVASREWTVALLGNPNTGKSTLFNALAGARQRVGNYPGVTVERKIGRMSQDGERITLVDLPGAYSLAPKSPDEMVTVDVLLGRRDDTPRPDVVLCVVDASNLERNLYLVSQVRELGLPLVIALNMTDVAQERGLKIDAAALQARLGVSVIPTRANRKQGLHELREALLLACRRAAETSDSGAVASSESLYPTPFREEVARLSERWVSSKVAIDGTDTTAQRRDLPRYLVERLILDQGGYLESRLGHDQDGSFKAELKAARDRLSAAGCAAPAVEAVARYGWIGRILEGVVERPDVRRVTASDRLDRLLTHRLWGMLVFLVIMVLVFQSVFRWSQPLAGWIEQGQEALGNAAQSWIPEGALQSLVVDGILAGVGGVLVFVPQIMILFFFIAILEDCGYMARAAYLMDKLMSRIGLSGKSFIPLLSSFACAIPGVMAARVIENRRDRLATILVAPLMSCSARLPVYGVLIAAFIPDFRYLGGVLGLRELTMVGMYLLGMIVAVAVAWILKKTILRGPTPPFVMELPSYKWPSPRMVAYRGFERGWSFVRRAGTLVVAVSILVWAALYYPRDPESVESPFRQQRQELEKRLASLDDEAPERTDVEGDLSEIENKIRGAYNRQSYLGRLGHSLEPIFRPLGWDWRIGCAVIASFPAREVVVATLGVIYNLGEVDLESEEESSRLRSALKSARWDGTDRPVYDVPVALSIMVFFALCAQCASTLVTIRRETNSWRWPAFTFVYMTGLAYLAALVVYQVGSRLG